MSADGERKGSWRDAVDERIIQGCEKHVLDGERLMRPPRISLKIRAPKVHVQPEDWGAGYLKEPREWDRPPQLVSDLEHSSPQSLLRDLYRPVREVNWHRFEEIEGTARQPLAGVMEARKARMIVTAPPAVEPVVRTVIALLHWRIGMMAERWEPWLPDDAPRKKTFD
jgi:hypothetical protein